PTDPANLICEAIVTGRHVASSSAPRRNRERVRVQFADVVLCRRPLRPHTWLVRRGRISVVLSTRHPAPHARESSKVSRGPLGGAAAQGLAPTDRPVSRG